MATLPTKVQLVGKAVTKGSFKSALSQLVDYVAQLAISGSFYPTASQSNGPQLEVDKGRIWVSGGLVVQAAQTIFGFVVTSSNTRIDRVVGDLLTGVATRIAGTESPTPVAPAIPQGKFPIAQIGPFTTSSNIVTSAMITDERAALIPSVGKQTLWIPASSMLPRVSNPAVAINVQETTTNKVNVRYLEFTNGADLFAQFNLKMPKSWDKGTFTARFYWYATAGTGNVTWGLQAVAFQNASALDTAFGTIQVVTPTLGTVNQLQVTADTAAITVGNSPLGEDWVEFQVKRSGTTDTLASPARLIGVQLLISTNAQDDS